MFEQSAAARHGRAKLEIPLIDNVLPKMRQNPHVTTKPRDIEFRYLSQQLCFAPAMRSQAGFEIALSLTSQWLNNRVLGSGPGNPGL